MYYKRINMDFTSLYPNTMKTIDDKEFHRKLKNELRKRKLNQINENNN